MRRGNRVVALAVALGLAGSGCFGSFNLTRKLYQWNNTVSQDKWIKEAVFIVFVWVPVYGLAGLGDAVLFNTIEFWNGKNPIDMKADGRSVQTRRVVRRDAGAVLKHLVSADAEAFEIEQFYQGQPAASLRITRTGEVTVASDRAGRVLFTAQTLPDGSLLVSDAQGKRVASYSPRQMERMVASSVRR